MNDNRFTRYSEIIDPELLERSQVAVIGVGAIGRQVALQLAAMGVGNLLLIDPDIVNEVNLGPQGYAAFDIDKDKVTAIHEDCVTLNPDCNVVTNTCVAQESESLLESRIIFCCVDCIEARKEIWELLSEEGSAAFWCDGRMAAELCRVISINTRELGNAEYYESTLFSKDEAFNAPCTARSTIYCANIAAGIMVSQFVKHLRKFPLIRDVEFNILAMSLINMEG